MWCLGPGRFENDVGRICNPPSRIARTDWKSVPRRRVMADDILSQAEVESLISAMEAAPPTPKPAPLATPQPLRGPARQREKVIGYDFKRPERVGKEQMRALQSLHEGFGRNFGAALSALLRSIVEVKLTSVDQLTYSEFVFSLENPTCFNLLRAEPLEGHLILDLNPS